MTSSPSRPTPPAAPAVPLVAVACPSCFAALAVGTDLAGLPADCPLCGGGFRVPPLEVPAAARSPASSATSVPDTAPPHRADRRIEPARPRDVVPQAMAPASADASVARETTLREPQPESELAVREPVRTVGSGDGAIVLRRLSPAERAARRTRRNLVMLVGGVSILLTIVLLLGRKR
ncbi:MAG: hypothetical protein RLZZ111_229 [Planctomycetota bacterium]|jgi:hypothetical protein